MNDLIAYILQFANLNKEQVDLIISKATEIELRKDDYFLEAGKIPRQIGFIVSGVIRACFYNNTGEEITRCFIPDNNLVVDHDSFESKVASAVYLQASTDCKLIVFSKKDWDDLSQVIVDWDSIKNKMIQKCMYQILTKTPTISQDASTRYLEFLENFPTLANRVALSHIASYLGITQQSLSRIRKNIR
jgi:CRP-like cAMP-binding protein